MMNIKIIDPIPENEVEVTLPFGSQVYGTANAKSDKDFVKLLKQSTGDIILQYQSNNNIKFFPNVDYIYTGLSNFLDQARSGANVAFFECLHTEEWRKAMMECDDE